MPTLSGLKLLLSTKWPYLATTVVILSALFLLAYCTGRKDGKSSEVVKSQAREIQVQTKVGGANETASGMRVEDAVKLQRQQQEIEDAVRNAKGPDDVRAKRGCVILRQQGRDTSTIPACR